jgi:hypothetical protein
MAVPVTVAVRRIKLVSVTTVGRTHNSIAYRAGLVASVMTTVLLSTPSKWSAPLNRPATPAVGQASPALAGHAPLWPKPDLSVKVVAPALSFRCNKISLPNMLALPIA